MLLAFFVGFVVALVIGGFVLMVQGAFGTSYIDCVSCGTRCEVSQDGWFYWKCDKCGADGKARPF